jgi:hypothetical protein
VQAAEWAPSTTDYDSSIRLSTRPIIGGTDLLQYELTEIPSTLMMVIILTRSKNQKALIDGIFASSSFLTKSN